MTAAEVVGNIDAMVFAIERVGEGDAITVDLLLEIHRRLLFGTRLGPAAWKKWCPQRNSNPCRRLERPVS